ncbi:IS982 family transposase [Spartinivicinus poritis]|uniref:IS982 family transposase n=1 Tax=Spartinivicinus poritis TaxID=2994640 RepID=A0ABT5UF76_9GAMM|nr:IS982 family transposase [Spartinivicinus sp. A2-2]MDE1465037.1 IS982 family transposase [Spartinivicinus sp. A2-2]
MFAIKKLQENGVRQKPWTCKLSISEILTILIYFHQSRYRDFKTYYTKHIQKHYFSEFPNLLSYSRFIEQQYYALLPLYFYLQSFTPSLRGIYFVDSTPLRVCHIKREKQHKVFKNTAAKGKTSLGWFYGFKLHLIINDKGELVNLKLITGNTDDRAPLKELAKGLNGKLFGDKGYISAELTEELLGK